MKKSFTLITFILYTLLIALTIGVNLKNGDLIKQLLANKSILYLGVSSGIFVIYILFNFYDLFLASTKKTNTEVNTNDNDGFDSQSITHETIQDSSKVEEKVEEIKTIDITSLKKEIQKIVSSEFNHEQILWKISDFFQIGQAVWYTLEDGKDDLFVMKYTFATIVPDGEAKYAFPGEGLTGQVIKNKKPYLLKEIPEGMMKIVSGLGETEPKSLLILPLLNEDNVIGVIEFASLVSLEDAEVNAIMESIDFVNGLN